MSSGSYQLSGFPAPSVIVNVAELYDFKDEVEAIGTTHADESVDISTSVTQTISKINFEEGQYVQQGEIIVELTSAEEKAALDEAEKQFNRVESLTEAAATTLTRRDQALLSLQVAQARYENRIIRAPFSGIIGLRKISEGALVSPGTVITTLDDISIIKLEFAVPEKFLSKITPGMSVSATSVAYPDKIFKGTIYVVDLRVDPATRAINVKAEIPNEDRLLKPGMLLQVKIVLSEEKVILLPEESIMARKNEKYVYVVGNEDKLEQRSVTLGRRLAGQVEVVSGIKEGEKVVMEGSPLLRPGQVVKIAGTKTIKESEQEFKNLQEE